MYVLCALARMLDSHRLRCGSPQSGPIFVGSNVKPLSMNNVLGRAILPALRKANLGSLWHGWHAARRGLGSNLYALGIPEKTIQAILRHANVSTTNTYYAKTAPADALAAMAKLEGAIPQLGNSWATESTESRFPVAVN